MSLNLNKIVKRDLMDSNPMAIKSSKHRQCTDAEKTKRVGQQP
jgi:hypothetical protein